jgi:hypothetical protein
VSQKKEILRLLVHDVTLMNEDDPWSVRVSIRWRTGVVSQHRADRPRRHPQETSPEVLKRIEELYPQKMDKEIAAILNAEGHRSGKGLAFTDQRVTYVRNKRGWMKRKRRGPKA